MTLNPRNLILFAIVGAAFLLTGLTDGWNVALNLLNWALIAAIMAMGVNIQWGYAGLLNVGTMGFIALGGLGTVLIAMPPVTDAWTAGGARVLLALMVGLFVIVGAVILFKRMAGRARSLTLLAWLIGGFFVFRWLFDPAVAAIEAVNPAGTGYLGGLGLPVIIGWPVGALLAAAIAWVIGKIALGLRSDYLAIATLGIAEIIISVMKNEDWLTRGVKNVVGVPRPVPYEVDLQADPAFLDRVANMGADPVVASAIVVKLCYAALFATVLIAILWAMELALKSPWGRMMRAIRDNETAAAAMGKDVTRRHLQIFVLGSAVLGIAGAMMITLDSQLVPGVFNPLRFTFLVWVMVIVGGSGNNWGAVLGGFLIWFLWDQAEGWGTQLMAFVTAGMAEGDLKAHLLDSVAHMRLLTMGLVLLLVLRFAPRGLIPEK